jgi:hypothetical protein
MASRVNERRAGLIMGFVLGALFGVCLVLAIWSWMQA